MVASVAIAPSLRLRVVVVNFSYVCRRVYCDYVK